MPTAYSITARAKTVFLYLSCLVKVAHLLVSVRYVVDDLVVVPDDALQLEECLERLLVQGELLVAEAEVVESLHAGRVVLERHRVELLGLLQVPAVEVAVAEVDEGGGIV